MVSKDTGLPVILPVHPRTRKMLATFDISVPECVRLIDPVGFMDFLQAESGARLVLKTQKDSGGCEDDV